MAWSPDGMAFRADALRSHYNGVRRRLHAAPAGAAAAPATGSVALDEAQRRAMYAQAFAQAVETVTDAFQDAVSVVLKRDNDTLVLAPEREEEPKICPRLPEIFNTTCDFYDVELTDFLSARRTSQLSRARQVACHLARKLTRKSFQEIGRRLGGRDHSTVLYSDEKIKLKLAQDGASAAKLKHEIALIEAALADADAGKP